MVCIDTLTVKKKKVSLFACPWGFLLLSIGNSMDRQIN